MNVVIIAKNKWCIRKDAIGNYQLSLNDEKEIFNVILIKIDDFGKVDSVANGDFNELNANDAPIFETLISEKEKEMSDTTNDLATFNKHENKFTFSTPISFRMK